MAEAKFFRFYLELLKLSRRDIAVNGKLICSDPDFQPQLVGYPRGFPSTLILRQIHQACFA